MDTFSRAFHAYQRTKGKSTRINSAAAVSAGTREERQERQLKQADAKSRTARR
jgi:hypothetical protein